MFWAIGAAALLAAALITFLPLLRGSSFWKPTALALVFLLPAAGLWIYSEVGTPEAIGVQGVPAAHAGGEAAGAAAGAEMEAMLESLRARLTESPADLDGWVLLARTLKTMQRFAEALAALETAHRIAPDDPFVMVELAEARIFTSADGRIDEASVAMLERAVELEPAQQKGLWLLGIAAAQAGDDAFAISYWESLLAQLEPAAAGACLRRRSSPSGCTSNWPRRRTPPRTPGSSPATASTWPAGTRRAARSSRPATGPARWPPRSGISTPAEAWRWWRCRARSRPTCWWRA